MKFFLLQLFALTAILFCLQCFISAYGPELKPIAEKNFICMFIVLFCVTAISHYILIQSAQKNPKAFTYTFMGTSMARLVIYGLFIVAYCYLHRGIAKPFAISFLLLYIIYTVFEIRSVLKFLKGK